MNEHGGESRPIAALDRVLACLWASRQKLSNISQLRNWLGAPGNPEAAAPPEIKALFGSRTRLSELKAELEGWHDVTLIPFGSAFYPRLLEEIYDPPILLFAMGAERALQALRECTSLSIVGSRAASAEGIAIASEFAREALCRGISVVSGLALGIDGAAHSGALEGAAQRVLPTVAVLGNGLPAIYPRRHERLARSILENGGILLSQFEPGTPAFPVNFLNRNRVIAGISPATLIIQAGLRSGSLVTARYALEEGREVLVVPGDIRDPRYAGGNEILKQGATLVTKIEDIFEACVPYKTFKNIQTASTETEALTPRAARIVAAIKKVGTIDQAILKAQFSDPTEFEETLLELELASKISRLPGARIQLRGP
jgi:DNA processing protein